MRMTFTLIVAVLAGVLTNAFTGSRPVVLAQDSERFSWQPANLVRIFGTHRGRLWGGGQCIAYAPDGSWIATGDSTHALRIWDPKTLNEVAAVVNLPGRVEVLDVSPDGTRILSVVNILSRAGNLAELRLWKISRGKLELLSKFNEFDEFCEAAQFVDQGRKVVCDGGHRRIQFLDIRNDKLTKTKLWTIPQTSNDVAVSPDGRWLVVTDHVALRLFDLRYEKPKIVSEKKVKAWKLKFLPKQNVFLAGGYLRQTHLDMWRIEDDGKLTQVHRVPEVAEHTISTIAISPDAKYFATNGGFRNAIRLFENGDPPQPAFQLRGHQATLGAFAFAPDGKSGASVGSDHTVRLWDLTTQPPRQAKVSELVHQEMPAPGAKNILALGNAQGYLLLEPRRIARLTSQGKRTTVFQLKGDDPRQLIQMKWIAKEGLLMITVRAYGKSNPAFPPEMKLLRLSDGKVVRSIESLPNSLLVGPSGKRLLWLDKETGLRIEELRTGKEILQSKKLQPDHQLIALHQDVLVTRRRAERGKLALQAWRIEGSKIIPGKRYIRNNNDQGNYVVTTPDQSKFALQFRGQRIETWSIQGDDLKQTANVKRPDGQYFIRTVSPDSQFLGIVSYGHLKDRSIEIVRFTDGKQVTKWNFPSNPRDITFSHDSKHVLTANPNGTIYQLIIAQ